MEAELELTYPRLPWLRFGFGLAAVAGLGVAGFVVLVVVELLVAGVVVPAGFVAAFAGTPVADAVSVVGVVGAPLAETGNEVNGVGSAGNGFDRMPAINSLRPASDL